MFGKKRSDNRLKCSFCGKPQDSVKKLIAGPGVYICDECVGLCLEILEEELNQNTTESISDIPFITDLDPILSFDTELNSLIEKVLEPLEQISNRYRDLREGSCFEPGIKSILVLKSIQQGRLNKELLPILYTLGEYYKHLGELKSAKYAYKWALEICDSDEACNDENKRSYAIELVKLLMKTGKFSEGDALLDKIAQSL